MQDRTLGELGAGLARYRAQLIPLLVVIVIALFFEGSGGRSAVDAAATPLNAATGAPQVGSASVPPALAGPTGGVAVDFPDLSSSGESFSGGTASGPSGDAPPSGGGEGGGAPEEPGQQAFSCEHDASLPMPVFAPVMQQISAALPPEISTYIAGAASCTPGADPLTLVVAQLGVVLAAAGPVMDVLRTANGFLPPVPVPPPIPLPGLPPELNPVLAGAYPVSSAVCGQLAQGVLAIAVLASLPLPITGQHASAILAPVFNVCSSLTGPGRPTE